MGLNRRQVIAGSGGLVASVTICRHLAQAAGGYPFTLGVASGEPASDGFVIWTRLAPEPLAARGGMTVGPVTVTWEIGADPQMKQILRSGTAVASGSGAFGSCRGRRA